MTNRIAADLLPADARDLMDTTGAIYTVVEVRHDARLGSTVIDLDQVRPPRSPFVTRPEAIRDMPLVLAIAWDDDANGPAHRIRKIVAGR